MPASRARPPEVDSRGCRKFSRSAKPAVVILELGANDGLRGLPIRADEAQPRGDDRAVAARRRQGAARRHEAAAELGSRIHRGLRAQPTRRSPRRTTRALLNPFLFDGLEDDPRHFQPDRLHPNEAAQPILLDTVWAEARAAALSRGGEARRRIRRDAHRRPHLGGDVRLGSVEPSTRSSTCARRPSSPTTICRAPSTSRCSTTQSARASARSTSSVSPFEAKRIGAALVSRNIARHIEGPFVGTRAAGARWSYCWRGGKRSGATGARAARDRLGRAHARGRLQGVSPPRSRGARAAAAAVSYFASCTARPGSGKSRLLGALEAAGAQVLDLEALAAHRGSVLGALPDRPQPSQKMFESRLLATLGALDPGRPVFVEGESRRIGQVQLPTALIESMRAAACVRLDAEPRDPRRAAARRVPAFLRRPARTQRVSSIASSTCTRARSSTLEDACRAGRLALRW